jgi:hypothetical protein
VWQSNNSLGGTIGTDLDILVARSSDAGVTWSPPAALNTNAAIDTGADMFPGLATDGSGAWIAVWQAPMGGTFGTDGDILFARSFDAGATWSAPSALNSDAAGDNLADQEPQISCDTAEKCIAVWQGGPATSSDWDIEVARSSDHGATWSTPAPLNSNTAVDSRHDTIPQLAGDGAGNWVVVWRSEDSLGGTIGTDFDILIARSSDEGLTWSAPAALNSNASSDGPERDDWPVLATDRAGNWIAVWSSTNSLGGTIGSDTDLFYSQAWGPDRDGDGLADGTEANVHGTDPQVADSDGDGLGDGAELNVHGTNPLAADSDGDGFGDGVEIGAGSDPNDAGSTPAPQVPALGLAGALALLATLAMSSRRRLRARG